MTEIVNMRNPEWEILDVLRARYKRTKHPFFDLRELKNSYGEEVLDDLNKLLRRGYVRKREGANGILVELLKPNK